MRTPLDREALVIGMALVPTLYSRNRHFALFEAAEMRAVRRRASTLRGIARHLAGLSGGVDGLAIAHESDEACELRYKLPRLRIERRASLTLVELACVRYLAGRAAGTPASAEDRARVDAALRRLSPSVHLAETEVGSPS